MKRLTVLFGFLLLVVVGSASADIFTCMDCTERSVKDPNGGHIEASCCMSQGGHCYTGDILKDVDVVQAAEFQIPTQKASRAVFRIRLSTRTAAAARPALQQRSLAIKAAITTVTATATSPAPVARGAEHRPCRSRR
jgi:hypothetical protein